LPLGFVTPKQDLTVFDRSTTRVTRGFAAALVLTACSSGSDSRPDTVASATAAAPPACTTGTAELTLPAGFCATIFADSLAPAATQTVASNGDVYVTIEGTKPAAREGDVGRGQERPEGGIVRRAARHQPRRPRRRDQAHRHDRQHRRGARERLPLRRRRQADRALLTKRHGARSRGQA
jgi:hypothetical protein